MSTRGPAGESLIACCNNFLAAAQSGDAKYGHIDKADMARVIDECNAAMSWLKEKQALQGSIPKHEVQASTRRPFMFTSPPRHDLCPSKSLSYSAFPFLTS